MKFRLIIPLIVLAALSCAACRTSTPELFPIFQKEKVGYINRKGEVVIQPQFKIGFPFSEGLALVCVETSDGCGYIDQTGKIIIPTEFKWATRFSDGLAAIKVADKIGYIDRTGKIVINPQFSASDNIDLEMYIFSEGLACVRVEDKFGFIDRSGKIAIPTQFEKATPFLDGLAAVGVNKKFGFIDKNGKFVIDPQFDGAEPFVNGLAAIKVGGKFGYIDKSGKIVITPQFDSAFPFSDEGLALVINDKKIGFINKSGAYTISPQFVHSGWFFPVTWEMAFFVTSDIGRVSFSEGLAPVKNSDGKIGYIDSAGNIVINHQFLEALPFYHDLAFVILKQSESSEAERGWIDKQGRFVWREVIERPSSTTTNTNALTNTNTSGTASPTPTTRTGRLITDVNLRSEPNKDATNVGIHFRNAKVQILDERRYERDGEIVTWYKIRVIEYGRSVNANITGGKNSPGDADEGWVNARLVSTE